MTSALNFQKYFAKNYQKWRWHFSAGNPKYKVVISGSTSSCLVILFSFLVTSRFGRPLLIRIQISVSHSLSNFFTANAEILHQPLFSIKVSISQVSRKSEQNCGYDGDSLPFNNMAVMMSSWQPFCSNLKCA